MSYFYAHQLSCEVTRRAFVWSSEASSPALSTVVEWFSNFRELIVASCADLQLNSPLPGGEGVVVQVDEAQIGRRKNNRERIVHGTWVVGMIDAMGEVRLEICPRREATTLGEIISRHVQVGSIVHTDSWRGYAQLTSRGFQHYQVNHSEEFVAPDSTHTVGVEILYADPREEDHARL